jgi:REP element-mobilizing transposase RayT
MSNQPQSRARKEADPEDRKEPLRSDATNQPSAPHSLTVAAQRGMGAQNVSEMTQAELTTTLKGLEAAIDTSWSTISQSIKPAEFEPCTWLLTFTCYGTWLHGDIRGSVDRHNNSWPSPPVAPDEERERREFDLLRHVPVQLGAHQRLIVHQTIREVCTHRGWCLHAVNVRTNHAHVVVTANRKGGRILNDFKSYATRRMKEVNQLPTACQVVLNKSQAGDIGVKAEYKVWTRGGSARLIDTEESFHQAIDYTANEQGPNITPGTNPTAS